MVSPYVCAVCGQPITLGRHESGWRHSSDKRSDHRVKPIRRDEYVPPSETPDVRKRISPQDRQAPPKPEDQRLS